jgi:glucokinase
MNNDYVLAIDLGGTNLRMAAVGPDGSILSHAKTESRNADKPQKLLQALSSLADECRAALTEPHQLVGIGAGVPANRTDGILQTLPNLPRLEGMNLKADLTAKFRVPVVIENDATAAAIGENWLGASKGVQDSIMITLGTGVGGGIIINNEPLRGIDGTAGKLGHICVEPNGPSCKCGSNGCLEQYASATAIIRMAQESGLNISTAFEVYQLAKGSRLSEPGAIATGSDSDSPPYEGGVAAAAADGVVLSSDTPHSKLRTPHLARAVFKNMARHLGIALGGMVNALNPEMIVIGGGVAAAWDIFIADLTTELHYRAFKEPATRVRIAQSTLADNAGLLGAARSAFYHEKLRCR